MKAITDPPTKSELFIGAFLLLVSGAFLFSSITPGHDWGGDFAVYMHQGSALASGSIEQFNMLANFRIMNSTDMWVIGPGTYPWGFPAILALVFLAFGESMLAMKLVIVGFVLGCQVLTYLLLRGRASTNVIYGVAFVLAFNTFVFYFKDKVVSDIPFTFFVLLILVLSRKFLLEKKAPSIANLIGLGVALFVAFSIRAHAIAMLPTVALIQLIGKTELENRSSALDILKGLKRIRPPDFIPYVIFAAGFAALSATLSDPIESYTSTGHTAYVLSGELGRVLKTISRALTYYGALPNDLFNAPKELYVLVIVPLLLLGFIRAGPRNLDLIAFVLFHMAVLLIYPARQGLRFVLPLLPILFFFLTVGGRELSQWLLARRPKMLVENWIDPALVAILVVGVSGPLAFEMIQGRSSQRLEQVESGPYSANGRAVFNYIKQNVAEDECVVFWKPRVLSYLTGRKSALAYGLEELTSGRYEYVLVLVAEQDIAPRGTSFAGLMTGYPQQFRPIYSNPDFVLYEILSDS